MYSFQRFRNFLLFSILLFGTWHFVFSQPVIEIGNRFEVGDRYSLKSIVLEPNEMNLEGESGPNRLWDFSNRVDDEIPSFIREFFDPTQTQYQSDFPTAILSTENTSGGYTYWDTIGTKLIWIGSKNDEFEVQLSNPAVLFPLPLSYLDSSTDEYSGTVTASFGNYPISGETKYLVDAWGTLITPADTFSNTVRLKFEEVDYLPSGDTCYMTMYSWLKNGIKGELFTVVYEQCISPFGGELSITASYRDDLDTAPIFTIDDENSMWEVSPNPASEVIQLNNLTPVIFKLFELSGKLIMTKQIQPFELIHIDELNSGVYLIKISDEKNRQQNIKLIKI